MTTIDATGTKVISGKPDLKLLSESIEVTALKCNDSIKAFLSKLEYASLYQTLDIYFLKIDQALKNAILAVIKKKKASPIEWVDALIASNKDKKLKSVLIAGLNSSEASLIQWQEARNHAKDIKWLIKQIDDTTKSIKIY